MYVCIIYIYILLYINNINTLLLYYHSLLQEHGTPRACNAHF